jgi:hypothetical protein
VIALVLAVSLGVAIALVTQSDSTPPPAPVPTTTFLPSPQASFPTTIPPKHIRRGHTPSAKPTNSATLAPSKRPHHTTSPSSLPTTASSAPSSGKPRITLSPTSGRQGTTITVFGTGFPAQTIASLRYAGGRSTSTATVGADGTFTGHLQADAVLPGTEQVIAKDGRFTAHATFTQQL